MVLRAPVVALDIGGTKLAAGVVEPSGRLVWRTQRATPRGDAEVLWEAVEEVLAAALESVDGRAAAVGVGCGGPMTGFGATVSPLMIPGWRGFPLQERVEEASGLPVAIDNDAKALALAEGWLGSAVGERNFLAMLVSTGVGAGVVLEGRLLHGADGNAGHIGHVVVDPDGPDLVDHVPGVLEALASGTAIAAHTGHPAEEATTAVVAAAGRLVGRAVGSVCNLLDLRLALVGGSVALGFGEPFFAAAQRELDRICRLDHSVGARIEPVGLGDQAPLVGAAALAYDRFGLVEPILGRPG